MAARLLANGAAQAGLAIALPFTILYADFDPADGFGAEEIQALALIGALAAALIGLRILELAQAERLGLHYVAQVRLALFDGLTSGAARTGHGAAMSRLMNDLTALKQWVGYGVARCGSAGLALGGCILAATMFSPWHALAIAAPCALVGLAAAVLAPVLTARTGAVRTARGRLANRLGETLLALDTLRAYDQTDRHRRRVKRATRDLETTLLDRMRVAAALRAAPDMVAPLAVVGAIAFGLPLRADSVGLVLLAGLAVGPLRQLLRAVEHRAAFVVARERLTSAMPKAAPRRARRPSGDEAAASEPEIGLSVLADASEHEGDCALIVSARTDVLPGTLARNIDLGRRFKQDERGLREIAEFCGLLDRRFSPDGLATRLRPDAPDLTEPRRARLSLARAIASGARDVLVDAPALLLDPAGRTLLRSAPERFGMRLSVVAGDLEIDWDAEAGRRLRLLTPNAPRPHPSGE